MKPHLLPAVLALLCATSAMAAEYYVVVPVKGRTSTAPAESIAVSLQAATLPAAMVGQAYSYNLRDHLLVTGDKALDLNQATLTTADTLPNGLSLAANGVLSGTPITQGVSTIAVKANYKSKVTQQSYAVTVVGTYSSCSHLLAAVPGTASGWHTLDVDGTGPVPPQSYYCDMTSDGGGWTRIVRQTEQAPVTNWTGGVNGSSYTLAASAIPAHTQVGFGKDEQATAIDYVNWVYPTGNIPVTALRSPKTAKNYQIYRNTGNFPGYGNPEETFWADNPLWFNMLTFDETGGRKSTWAFAPNGYETGRGWSFGGTLRDSISDTFAWTVWVR